FAAGDRGGHLLALLERLGTGLNKRPQRLALTATIGNPEEMCKWLSGASAPARRISAPIRSNMHNDDFSVRHFTDGPITASQQRLQALVQEVSNRRTLTFVRSRS